MSLTPSSANIDQLEATLTKLASLLNHPSTGTWRAASHGEVQALLEAALESSMRASRRLLQYRAQLGQLLDTLAEGLAVFDLGAQPIHQNAAVTRLLAEEPECERILATMRSIVHALAALARPGGGTRASSAPRPAWRELRTERGRYQLRGSMLGESLLGTSPVVVVAIECMSTESLSDLALQQQYRLTRREIEVARLLSQGRANDEIAEDLGISTHTARRHTESVLSKLGVHTRAAAGAKLKAG
ncbi:MAG TPA: helix-turn-helix transcriptional regulator [Gemmatimonadaceae bacterium]